MLEHTIIGDALGFLSYDGSSGITGSSGLTGSIGIIFSVSHIYWQLKIIPISGP